EEEVDAEAGVPADAELDPAERLAELVAPPPGRPRPRPRAVRRARLPPLRGHRVPHRSGTALCRVGRGFAKSHQAWRTPSASAGVAVTPSLALRVRLPPRRAFAESRPPLPEPGLPAQRGGGESARGGVPR